MTIIAMVLVVFLIIICFAVVASAIAHIIELIHDTKNKELDNDE